MTERVLFIVATNSRIIDIPEFYIVASIIQFLKHSRKWTHSVVTHATDTCEGYRAFPLNLWPTAYYVCILA